MIIAGRGSCFPQGDYAGSLSKVSATPYITLTNYDHGWERFTISSLRCGHAEQESNSRDHWFHSVVGECGDAGQAQLCTDLSACGSTAEEESASVCHSSTRCIERHVKVHRITEAAAQQIKDELAEKWAKAEARRLEMVGQATVEYLRQGFGKTTIHKLTPGPVQEKRADACRLSPTMARGMHKARSNLHPSSIRAPLRNSKDRKSMESRLRARTWLSLHRCETVQQYLPGPANVIEAGVGAPAQKLRKRRGYE